MTMLSIENFGVSSTTFQLLLVCILGFITLFKMYFTVLFYVVGLK